MKALEAAETSSRPAPTTKLGYKVGVRVNLDVLNAQTQLYSTQRDLARARYEVLLNSLRLRRRWHAESGRHRRGQRLLGTSR
ncbi:MAG: TolC family protein [Sphaerotilus natans]